MNSDGVGENDGRDHALALPTPQDPRDIASREPRRRGKASKTLALVNASIEILAEIQPATVRAVCYRLFVRGLIDGMSKGSTNAVSTHLVWAREQGSIPWGWIVDETREAESIASWRNPEEIFHQAVRQYRKDYWVDQPTWLEVWSEKGTVRGTLSPILSKYGVTFRVMRGYGSATTLHGIADETRLNPKTLQVLYVGDWDPSGLHMSEIDIPRRLDKYGADAVIERVALSVLDINSGIPSFPAETKSRDPRHQWFTSKYGHRCWELDALSPPILRDRIEAEITSLLDAEAWEHAIEIEKAERESMQTYIDALPGISMQAKKYSSGWPS